MNHNLNTRETLVVECHTDTPIGTDRAGHQKVQKYLTGAAKILDLAEVAKPRAHISELYGLSGWAPLDHASAIHLYAWDDRTPSFISVDIATRQQYQREALIKYTQEFFDATSPNLVHKNSHEDASPHWRELEPSILRQRSSIVGETDNKISNESIASFLPRLAHELDMVTLTEPIFAQDAAWMHWETSGVLIDRRNNEFDLDIYTCKSFSPKKAEAFARENLNLNNTILTNY